MPTVAFLTVGCKLNQYESQAIADSFTRAGYTVVDADAAADVYVINTCTVTAKSDATSRKFIRRAVRANPRARVVAVGCATQVDPGQFADIDGVDLVLGSANKADVLEHLEHDGVILPDKDECNFDACDIDGYRSRSRAFIKIQEGCDHYCTYCVIPYARGRLKSRDLPGVVTQVRRLAAAGYRETVVCGTHLGLYGRDLGPDAPDLLQVLDTLCALPGRMRYRLSSLEPMDLTDNLVDFIAAHPRICRHLHLPVQGAQNTVLRRMNRPYTIETYSRLLNRLAEAVPGISLGADVITAFPGETDAQHREACAALEQLPLAYFHVFPYSPRPGTPAADYPDQVDYHTSRARVHDLLAIRQRKIDAFHRAARGVPLQVIVESTRDAATGRLVGMSDNYLRVLIDGPDDLVNRVVTAVPETYEDGRLTGRLQEDR